jgi:K+-sensing histidine kinase KdpD
MSNELRRSDPDVLLARLKAEEETPRGKLRIWLGAAPGAGKTYAMASRLFPRGRYRTTVPFG